MTVTPFDSLTITFEVSWSTNPYATPSYTDESAYVRSFTIRRGRSKQFDQFPAGTMEVELENSGRRFDPLYTSSPLSPNVLPRKKCRMTATYAGTPYRLFTGFIDSIDQEGEQSNTLGTTRIVATDGFKMLARSVVDTVPDVILGAGETIAEQVGRLLDIAAWPAADRDIDTDSPTTNGLGQTGATVISLLTAHSNGDVGLMFIAGDGDFTYRGHRWQLTNNLTASATLGELTTSSEIPYTDVDFSYDDVRIFNRAKGAHFLDTAGTLVETAVDISDATSVAAFGESTMDIGTTGLANTNVLQNTLEYILAYYKDAKLRVDQVAFDPRGAPTTMYPVVLAAEIGTRWTFKRRPQNVGSAISQDVIVEGLSYSMTPSTFECSFDLSQAPTAPDGGTYWRMGFGKWTTGSPSATWA